jgi:phosphatidylinositol alpha-1,6-mannosyltransferase
VVSSQDYATAAQAEDFNARQPFQVTRLRPVANSVLEGAARFRVMSASARALRPLVIVASGARAVWLGALVSRRHRVPLMAIGHGSEFGESGWESRLTRWSFEQAAVVVCVSRYTEGLMTGAAIRPRRAAVVPNGADDSRFGILPPGETDSFRRNVGLNGDRVLLSVGNVTARKGQETVIRALPRVLEQIPNARYVMVGLPTEQAALSALATSLGVAHRVAFAGAVDHDSLVRYLNACDLFVMTSRRTADGDVEGYGIAVVEAALCGKPAVVSAGSGLSEAIEDGQTGIAVPEGDAGATAAAIVSLLVDDARRRAMGERARARATREQTWADAGARYDALLRSMLPADTAAAATR